MKKIFYLIKFIIVFMFLKASGTFLQNLSEFSIVIIVIKIYSNQPGDCLKICQFARDQKTYQDGHLANQI